MARANLTRKTWTGPRCAFNVDGKLASELITGAVGQENWEVEIKGKASHAGVAPEKGISATLVASIALAEAHRGGWFGKVVKPNGHGTSNVGVFGGKEREAGRRCDQRRHRLCSCSGEARSPDVKFAAEIAAAYQAAFKKAQGEVKDAGGEMAEVKFTAKPAYPSFNLDDNSPAVNACQGASSRIGLKPTLLFSNGGLDANWFSKHVPTVTIGAGQYEIHTVKEYVDVPEFVQGCRLGRGPGDDGSVASKYEELK